MRTLLLKIMAALAISAASHAANLDVSGILFTPAGIETVPITVAYDDAGTVDWLEPGYTIATPEHGGLTLTMQGGYTEADDAGYPEWPGLVLLDGVPHSMDYIAGPVGAFGLLMTDREIEGEVIPGWSVQAFVEIDGRRFGLASAPLPHGVFAAIPEPEHTALAGVVLLGVFAVRRMTSR